MTWETVIGLEVHAHLLTQTKLFCGCPTTFGKAANANTCEVCLGMPGALPVLNKQVVELALRAAIALECAVQPHSEWSRKQYFYPDLSKGYQISQYDKPYALNGKLQVGDKSVRIQRIHMEEDAGKTVHATGYSLVDYNRASVPLVEIVSHPDLSSADEAAAYLKALREILVELKVCDGNMEEGSLRCDANVSIRKPGAPLGTRVELKNINSFKFVIQAINYEVARQQEVLENGGTLRQETRLFDSEKKTTRPMRSKEEANDYRYFPDPDLPELAIDPEWIARVTAAQPELPAAKRERYKSRYGLSDQDAEVLTSTPEISARFEQAGQELIKVDPKASWKPLANFIQSTSLMNEWAQPMNATVTSASSVATLVHLAASNVISVTAAKSLLPELRGTTKSVEALIQEKGLAQVSDTSAIEAICQEVIAANPDSVASYKSGKAQLFGFFVGQVMKKSGGKLNPALVSETLKKLLA